MSSQLAWSTSRDPVLKEGKKKRKAEEEQRQEEQEKNAGLKFSKMLVLLTRKMES